MVQRLTFASCVSELFIARSSGTLLLAHHEAVDEVADELLVLPRVGDEQVSHGAPRNAASPPFGGPQWPLHASSALPRVAARTMNRRCVEVKAAPGAIGNEQECVMLSEDDSRTCSKRK